MDNEARRIMSSLRSRAKRLSVISLVMIPSLLLYQIVLLSRGSGGDLLLWPASSSICRGLMWSKKDIIPQEETIMMAVEYNNNKLQNTTTKNQTKIITTALDPAPAVVVWVEDTTMIYNQNVTYRFSAKGLHNANNNIDNGRSSGIIVGVLSSAKTRGRRDAVRQTWAAAPAANNIFFLLAGDWEFVQDEFITFHDILWINHTESYKELTWKTAAFIVAIQEHVDNFTYLVKTDDDSYVYVDRMEEHLTGTTTSANNNNNSSTDHLDYIGCCMGQPRSPDGDSLERIYPPYASGAGYLISRRFATCFASVSKHFYYGVIPEDAMTGLIARECHVTCTNDERIYPWPEGDSSERQQHDDALIQHYINPPTMFWLHGMKCSSFNNGTIDTTASSTSNSPSCSLDNTDLVLGGTIPIMNHGKVAYRLSSPNKRTNTPQHDHANTKGGDGNQDSHDCSAGGDDVVAVLSMPGKDGSERRSGIRNTWAKNCSNVYFIVATSNYDNVKHEFFEHRDIFWILREGEEGEEEEENNHHDDKRLKVADKMSVFAAAIQKHLNNNNEMTEFRHILKVDDDSYVYLDTVEKASASGEYRDKDFIGDCNLVNASSSSSVQKTLVWTLDTADEGYLMSLRFAVCLVQNKNDNTDLVLGGTIPIMNHGKVAYQLSSPNKRTNTPQHHHASNTKGDHDSNDGSAGGGVVVAVLSRPGKEGRERRSGIRNTWAKNHSNVYFIVATGDYNNYLKHEFFEHRDIFWILHEEEENNHHDDKGLRVADKMIVFAAAIQKHLLNNNNTMAEFRHIFKVDDDSHLYLDTVEKASAIGEFRDKDFIGDCNLVKASSSSSVQKTLDTTEGYLMSFRFADCLVQNMNAALPWVNHNINASQFLVGGTGKFSSTWCNRHQFECFAME